MELTADFRNLIFLNYRVDREVLEARVPPGVELELLDGHPYISLVAFLFENLHVQGFSAPFHQQFEEVNLRFYVKDQASPVEKHGVVFIREIVPKTLIAATARLIFNEKYIRLPMEHPDWRIAPVFDVLLECDIAGIFGTEFVPYLTLKPSSAFIAEGSHVIVKS